MSPAVVAGAGYIRGTLPGSPNELAAEAIARAAADAGITRRQVDGVVYQAGQGGGLNQDFARLADVPARFLWHVETGGSSALAALITAAQLIEAGAARHIAVVYASSQKSRHLLIGADSSAPQFQAYGLYSPGGYAALRASRYLGKFGLSGDAFAPVALRQREYALQRPDAAYYGRPLTKEDYAGARYVVEPLRLFDYCQPTDAGAAVIVSARSAAAVAPAKQVALAGFGLSHTRAQSGTGQSEYEGVRGREAVQVALRMADVELADIDVAEVYDAFAIAVLEQLEEIGVCGPGEASAFIAAGETAPGGRLPVNTGGGQLSWGYMQGLTPIIEAVRQLRGEAGATTVQGATHCLVTTPGGWATGRAFGAAVLRAGGAG